LSIKYIINIIYKYIINLNFILNRYNQLLGIIPSDPGVLQKLGEMYDSIGDKQQAFQFYNDVSIFYISLLNFFTTIVIVMYIYFLY